MNDDRENRPPLSAYIRVQNESRMIADVVKAALTVAREVVVIDSGSTDDTMDIARAAGAHVIEQSWLGNGFQKRCAEDHCRYDWLLDLDADEIITSPLADEIKMLFAHGEPPHPIYRTMLALAPPVGDPWMDFGLATRHKLYNRKIVRAPEHKAWDQFEIPAGVNVGNLRSPILHHAFTGAGHFLDKLNRNTTLRAAEAPMRSKTSLALRITCGLPFYFAKRYFLNQYFRGGVYGFALALMSGYGRWLRDVKMWERMHSDNNS